ncbi:Glycosyl hydrolase family 49 [Mucilaginibacter gossypiicola]|uniref:Glycosyl hydrolase family 49 n=1 Tax=Mucilaginibacter gossypiicola TaxID=551995 RepID=A0A1H8LQ40_9SPHI|nr:glycosyl hydrolase family 28 protein [Mucilaginibacter gossypiicola]SEO07272.1 Glycosyl hydrolase family 49 [Mucilaginibacter gossypiicola]
MKLKISLLLCMVSIFNQLKAQLITYTAPTGAGLNTDYTVKVRQKSGPWQSVPVYAATVADVVNMKSEFKKTSFAYFDFSGEVEVAVTYNRGPIENARIRPVGFGIIPKHNKKNLTFLLKEPKYISVEVNGDIFHNLQLFGNPLEITKPSTLDTNVIYFGPGIHVAGIIKPKSNQTVYIAGGAIVQGQILINKVQHVRVTGRGILTQLPVAGNKVTQSRQGAAKSRNDQLTINYSSDIEVEGITVLPHKYSICMGQVNKVNISNFKSISFEGNADGIDVFCSSNVAINNIFMRNSDDCIALYGHRWNFYGNVDNVSVKNAVLWADIAHPILAGTHGDPEHPDTLRKLSFKNIDILEQHEHQVDYQGCLALNAGDSNLIEEVSFEDIRIEDFREGQLLNLRVMFNHKYNTAAGFGIRNVLFKNIRYNGSHANLSVIAGYNETRNIRNVTFENLSINGLVIADDMAGKPVYYKTSDMGRIFISEHADNIIFKSRATK